MVDYRIVEYVLEGQRNIGFLPPQGCTTSNSAGRRNKRYNKIRAHLTNDKAVKVRHIEGQMPSPEQVGSRKQVNE